MMTDVSSVGRQATLAATALMHSVTTEEFGHCAKTAQTKSLHQEHLTTTTGHIPGYFMGTTLGTYHSPLTTHATTEDASPSHYHTTNPVVAEALATIKDMHPTPHSNNCSSSHYPSNS